MPQLKLVVNEVYKSYVPRPSIEDYAALKKSIRENGYFPEFPIIANDKNEILDGYTRYEICNDLGIIPKIEIKSFKDKYEEALFVIDINLSRRQLIAAQRVELGMKIDKIIADQSKERQLSTLKKGNQIPIASKEANGDIGKTSEIVAKRVGLTKATYERGKKVFEDAPEEVKDKVRKGKTTITHAYMEMQKEAFQEKKAMDLPEGKFNVILADPPWKYEVELRGNAQNHYATNNKEKISELKVPVADDAILFLWATNPKIQSALDVAKAWGFEYKTNFVWVKDKIGNGFYVRAQHELLLIAVKGKMETPLEKNRPSSVINANRNEHSSKPEIVYELIEKMYPNQKYLELYARNKRKGWTSWGNEVS